MRIAAITIIFLFSLVTSAQAAPVINGGFETANLTGWGGCAPKGGEPPQGIGLGGAGVVAGLDVPAIGPPEGHYMAMLAIGDGRNFLDPDPSGNGLPPGIVSCLGASSAEPGPGISFSPLDYPPGDYPFGIINIVSATVIWQTFSAKGGSQVSFEWNYLTNDGCGGGVCTDPAFVSLNGVVQLLSGLMNTSGSPILPSGDYGAQSGFMTTTLSLPTDGVYVLAFGVAAGIDFNASSALLIDNVQRIPEPRTLALLGLAFAGIGFSRRRKLT